MERAFIFLLSLLTLHLLSGCKHLPVYKPTYPAGDESKFIARYVAAEDAAFQNPDVENGPWNLLIPKKVILLPQNITTPSKYQTSVSEVEVRAVHNGKWIGVAVSWQDDSQNQMTAAGIFSDAVAIGFPQKDPSATSPFMGGPNAGMEINYWKALWQRDIDEGYQEVTDLHPNIVADEYLGYHSEHLPDSNPASTASMKEVMATAEGRESLPAVAIGNPMSQIERKFPVEQSVAEGFGSLSTQQQQDARGSAVYRDGGWIVVITRPLNTGDSADATLAVGKETAINFAVWEGSNGDVSGRKNYAMFTPLLIQEKK